MTFDPPHPTAERRSDMFAINRIVKSSVGRVPKFFSEYQTNQDPRSSLYYADRDHPSAEDYWSGYYPERQAADIYCTMDRSYGRYQFDKLISDYMYDRLMRKI